MRPAASHAKLGDAMMTYDEFLTLVIARGLESIKTDEQLLRHPKRMEGAREGFEACRGRDPSGLSDLLSEASKRSDAIRGERLGGSANRPDIEDYWKARYFFIQIEWVCNTVSAALMFATDLRPESKKFVIVQPTARGMVNAARILQAWSGEMPS